MKAAVWMKNIKNKIAHLWKDESAQGATEYILLLVIVVSIALIFRKEIEGIIKSKASQVGGQIDAFKVDGGN